MEVGKVNLQEMKSGDKSQGYVLLSKVDEAVAKNGNKYCNLTLADGNTTVEAKIWKAQDELNVEPGIVIGVHIDCQDYNGKKSFVVQNIARGEDIGAPYKPSDFLEKPPIDSETMYAEILEMVSSTVSDEATGTLADLTLSLYEKNKEKLLYWSAAESIHHNMYAGLLYHTYRMMKQAKLLVEVYPSLDAELLFSAVALHDIGKLFELETDAFGASEYTIDGQLFGHALIGIQMIDEAVTTGDYDPEKVRCLKHCVASHHGQLDWGAITLPRIEEAAVLHYIDLIDSRIQQYEKTGEGMESGTTSDDKVWGLDKVKVYKPTFKA